MKNKTLKIIKVINFAQFFAFSFIALVIFYNVNSYKVQKNDINASVLGVSDGTYLWGKSLGSTPIGQAFYPLSIKFGPNKSIYTLGVFSGTNISLGGSTTYTSSLSGGASDWFITKYNSDGSLSWIRTIPSNSGSPNYKSGFEVATDGSVLITGEFKSTIDFDDSSATDTKSPGSPPSEGFITKFSASGAYQWTKTFNSGAADYSIISDAKFATDGSIWAILNHYVSASNLYGFSLLKLDSSGNLQTQLKSEVSMSADNIEADELDLASNGDLYITGRIKNAVTFDFDLTSGSDSKVAPNPNWNGFITKFSGVNYGWTKLFGGNISSPILTSAVGPGSEIFISGEINTTTAVGLGGSTTFVGQRNFLTRFNSDSSHSWALVDTGNNGSAFAGGRGIAILSGNKVVVTGRPVGNPFDTDGTSGTDNKTKPNANFDAYSAIYNFDGTYFAGSLLAGNGPLAVDANIDGEVIYYIPYSPASLITIDIDPTATTDNKSGLFRSIINYIKDVAAPATKSCYKCTAGLSDGDTCEVATTVAGNAACPTGMSEVQAGCASANGGTCPVTPPPPPPTTGLDRWFMGLDGKISVNGGINGLLIPDTTVTNLFGYTGKTYATTDSVLSGNGDISADSGRISAFNHYAYNYINKALDLPFGSTSNKWFDALFDRVNKNNFAPSETSVSNIIGNITSNSLNANSFLAVNPKEAFITAGDLIIQSGSSCNAKVIIFVRGNLTVNPDFKNTSSDAACMFIVAGNLYINKGSDPMATNAGYNIIEGFFIVDGETITYRKQ